MKRLLVKILAVVFIVSTSMFTLSACDILARGYEKLFGELPEFSDHQHEYPEEWKVDDNMHWRECSCGRKTDEEEHKFSEEWIIDDNMHWRECSCGRKIDEEYHNPGDAATETTPQTCTECDYVIKPALGVHVHSFDSLKSDSKYHWYQCACGQDNGRVEHSGGMATCSSRAVCTSCNSYYGDVNPLNHNELYVHTESGYYVGCEKYSVVLKCRSCSYNATHDMVKMGEKLPGDEHGSLTSNCQQAGYDEYCFEYTSNGQNKGIYVVRNKANAASEKHLFVSGRHYFHSVLNEKHQYGGSNKDAISALLAAGVLRPISPLSTCNKYATIVADCAICRHPITFDLSGEHQYVETSATCTTDGMYDCKNCGVKEIKAYATGHNYEYVDKSFNSSNRTISIKCSECTSRVDNVSVMYKRTYTASNCKEESYDEYITGDIGNGLGVSQKNYKVKQILLKVIKENQTGLHVLHTGSYTITGILNNGTYNYDNRLINAVNNGVLRWITTAPVAGKTVMGVFDCHVCGHPIVINVIGK